ncbi:hypothetical protein QE367_001650 [Microbacterium paludicola]|uniref:O-antigen ligase domain-containing protein n=1 Tax=Microbacterium paludicola TaxID=300019 RepID=A0ABU1I1D5_9MICO|nr:hypothetical protein [Microbacterium paludicola]MDR6167446.1 hypothetical protein [Microbacterium paludicola]
MTAERVLSRKQQREATAPVSALERTSLAAVVLAIVCVWLLGWVPNLLTLLTAGRGQISGLSATVEVTELAVRASNLLSYGAFGLLLIAILFSLPRVAAARPGPYVLLLVAWGVINLLSGADVSLTSVTLPVFVFAWMLVRPPARYIYRLLAWVGVATAAISVGFALVSPLAFMSSDWAANADKALFGNDILAGPYSHSNALGLSLALTLPFVALNFKRTFRLAAVVLVSGALLWSASRLSTAAAVFALCASIIAIRASEPVARRLLSVAIMGLASVIVVLPLLTTNPTFFTNRGLIWMTSLRQTVDGAWLIGGGGSSYREVNELTTAIGFVSTTGHNLFVTFFTTGGIVTVLLILMVLVTAYMNARRVFNVDRLQLLFLSILLVLCVAEDPLRALALGPQSFVIYPMLLAMIDTSVRGASE